MMFKTRVRPTARKLVGRKGGRSRNALVASALVVGAFAMVPAGANHGSSSLSGSNFEIDTDANMAQDHSSPSIDWATVAEVSKQDSPSGSADESFGNGTKEDTASPIVVDGGIPPNKSDLKFFGVYQEGETSNGFLNLYWSRVQDPSGTTNMDFELNQKRCVVGSNPATCAANGITPLRTGGDKLITYDLSRGGTVATISLRVWGGSAWGSAEDLTTQGLALGTVNTSAIAEADSGGLGAHSPRTFGEAQIKMTALFSGVTGCNGFGSAYLKSRASDSFTAALKDFVPPQNVNITNCGQVSVHKQDDAGTALPNIEFQLYNDLGTVGGTREAANIDTITSPLLSCTTDASGDCTILNVPFGEYWVHEVAPPSGYTAAADQHVTVSADTPAPATLTFVNTRNPASVTLHKQDDAGIAMANVTFTLYNDFGTIGGTRQATNIDTVVSPTKSCTTDNAGNCTITGILPAGNFWLVETVPAGYVGAADRAITLTLGQNLDVSGTPFVNTRQFRVVTFVCIDTTDTLHGSKVSYDGAALPGANNTPVVGGAITTAVEGAICGLGGTAVHAGAAGSHSSSVSIP